MSTRQELERELRELDSILKGAEGSHERRTFFSTEDHTLFRNLKRAKDAEVDLPEHVRSVIHAAERALETIEQAYCNLPHRDDDARDEVFLRLLDAKTFIEENYSREIDLEQMAHQAAISNFYFVRLFKRVFGLPPYQYLLQYRLKRSADMLLMSELPIYEIAMRCGFDSHITYSTQFKQFYSIPPSRYRMVGGRV